MRTDFSKYKPAYATTSRATAQMAQELLKQSGYNALAKQASATESLSVIRGNALLPFEEWGVYVEEPFINEVKELLKNIEEDYSLGKIKETTARNVIKPFIWIFLTIFFGALVLGIWFMIKGVMESRIV